jgi:ribosomal-protein-alanine N-acetyltransferase
LGFSIFWVVHDELHILNVATALEHRRRGVGRAALEATLEHGRRHRCTLATLEVRKSNVAALELYKSLRFRPVGVRPNYYADEGEDAIVMVLDL